MKQALGTLIMALSIAILYFYSWYEPKYDFLYIDGLAQDFNIPSALVMEILQSCSEPSIYRFDTDIFYVFAAFLYTENEKFT